MEGTALCNLGIAYFRLGEARRASEYSEQALAIAREIGDRRGEGNRLRNLGSAFSSLGEAQRAIEFYEQALAIARETGDRRLESECQGQLAAARGEYDQALQHYRRAGELNLDDPTGYNFDMALVLLRLGRADEALEMIQARLAAQETPSDLQDMLPDFEALAAQEPPVEGAQTALELLQERAGRGQPG
jgi:tetratricopeptide (TPR) repeat protein